MNPPETQPQQQFPPPPPYAPNSTVAIKIKTSKNCYKTQQQQRELKNELENFKYYKQALGSTLFCACFYVIYTLLVLAYFQFQSREIVIALALISTFILAITGIFSKNYVSLLPMLCLFVVAFCIFFSLFLIAISTLIKRPDKWAAFIREEFPRFNYYGLSTTQATVLLLLLDLLCIYCSGYIIGNICAAIEGMSKYCKELHNIALNMIGSTTNLSDPALVAHLLEHQKRKKSTIINV